MRAKKQKKTRILGQKGLIRWKRGLLSIKTDLVDNGQFSTNIISDSSPHRWTEKDDLCHILGRQTINKKTLCLPLQIQDNHIVDPKTSWKRLTVCKVQLSIRKNREEKQFSSFNKQHHTWQRRENLCCFLGRNDIKKGTGKALVKLLGTTSYQGKQHK